MTVEVGDILRVTAKMSVLTDDVQNVYHYEASGTGTATDAATMTAIALALDDAYEEIVAELTTGLRYDTIEFFNVTQDVPMGEDAWPNQVTGSAVGEILPLQCSAVCLFGTATARSQGRKFLPPMKEEASDSRGVVNAATITAILLLIIELLTGVTVGTLTFHPGNWNLLLTRFAEWISGTINPVMKTQRRRVAGVGA